MSVGAADRSTARRSAAADRRTARWPSSRNGYAAHHGQPFADPSGTDGLGHSLAERGFRIAHFGVRFGCLAAKSCVFWSRLWAGLDTQLGQIVGSVCLGQTSIRSTNR
jgi:hypothetical protein